MSTNRKSSFKGDVQYLQSVLDLALQNAAFRKGLVMDPAAAIDRFSQVLHFDHSKLSLSALEVLGSLTNEELCVLSELNQKARDHKAPRIMMPL
jgi:hypothetical protein